MTRAVVATALMLLLSTSSALAAESTWDVLERFGLSGTWSATCGEPATVSRFHTIFSKDADGLARREIDFGVKSIYATFVDGAEMISPSMLKITVRNAHHHRLSSLAPLVGIVGRNVVLAIFHNGVLRCKAVVYREYFGGVELSSSWYTTV